MRGIRRALLIETLLNLEFHRRQWYRLLTPRLSTTVTPQRFRLPEAFSLQTISIIPPANATPDQLKEARKRAENAFERAKATKSYEGFGVLAERISEDDYRVMMGDHTFVDRAKLPVPILQAALRMQTGQVSDLIQVDEWYTVFRLNTHRPAGMQKFADVQESLRKELQQQNTEALRSQLSKRLRAKAKVEEL